MKYETTIHVGCAWVTPKIPESFPVTVEYEYSPYVPGSRDQPPEQAYLIVKYIEPTLLPPREIELALCDYINSMEDFEHLENEIAERMAKDEEDRAADYAEWVYEQRFGDHDYDYGSC